MKKLKRVLLAATAVLGLTACHTPDLAYAIIQGDAPTALAQITEKNVNVPRSGQTPLMWAVISNKPEIVKGLIAKKADVNQVGPNGTRPLPMSIVMSGAVIQRMLLESGADVNAANDDGTTPLLMAAGSSQADMVRTLIDKGANVNAASAVGNTPLMLAASRGNILATRLLIARQAQINVESKEGNTPLSLADPNNIELIKLLIDKGANPAYRNKQGRSIEEQRALVAEQIRKAQAAQKK